MEYVNNIGKDGDITMDEMRNHLETEAESGEAGVGEAENSSTLSVSDSIRQYDKFIVVAVAGQSNAVGYDESPIAPYTDRAFNPQRVMQLGFLNDDNLKLVPLTSCAQNFQDMTKIQEGGTKGIHLPLANLMLRYIPEDYGVLILPCAYGGTGFLSGSHGTYNRETMKPSEGVLRWGVESAYYKALVDRIKYVLGLNPNNLFAGLIWIQGEADSANAANHQAGFQAMTEDFFSKMNEAGYGARTPKGRFDKDIWYNVETVSYWYTQGQCQQIWDNYKSWNPNTYIKIPRGAQSNLINGTGKTTANKPSHYGNNSYRDVIAPLLVEGLRNNGAFTIRIRSKKEVCNAYPELSRLAAVSDIITKEKLAVTLDHSSGVLRSKSTTLSCYTSCLSFGDIYRLDFEATRCFYWVAFEGDINTVFTAFCIGSGSVGWVSSINTAGQTITPLANKGGVEAWREGNLASGDRVSIFRNRDGSIEVYKMPAAKRQYKHWFRLDPYLYSNTFSSSKNSTSHMIGFTYGVSPSETEPPFNTDITALHKNILIWKEAAPGCNPAIDIERDNTILRLTAN